MHLPWFETQCLETSKADSMSSSTEKDDRSLDSMIGDLQERIFGLKLFDGSSEVNAHCDDLESQVIMAVESAVLHLNKAKKEFLAEINRYRVELLASKPAEVDNSGLAELDGQIKAIKTELADQTCLSDERIETAKRHLNDLTLQSGDVMKRIRKNAFQGRFMRFHQNNLFALTNDAIGRLECSDLDVSEDTISTIVLDELEAKSTVFQVVPPNPNRRWNNWPESGDINALIFLADGNVAIAPAKDFVQIWNPQTGELAYKLESKCWTIMAFVQMPNGYLIAGDVYGRVEVWDLDKRTLVRYLVGHKSSVCSFKLLANGLVASYSQDDSIIIWNPYREASLVTKITGHGNSLAYPPLDIFSNGFLVSSTEKLDLIRIWSPRDGKLVKELPVSLPDVKSFFVLPNDDIALVNAEGDVRILNFVDEIVLRKLRKPPGAVVAMTHLSGGGGARSLFVILRDTRMPLLASESSNPYRYSVVESCDFSPDKKVLATVGSFGRLVLWLVGS